MTTTSGSATPVVAAGTLPRLSRSLPCSPPAPHVRIVHLGLGNFHRAHQAWYTAHATDAAEWGSGVHRSSPRRRRRPHPEHGLYTFMVRSAEQDRFKIINAPPPSPR